MRYKETGYDVLTWLEPSCYLRAGRFLKIEYFIQLIGEVFHPLTQVSFIWYFFSWTSGAAH
jgi:hypothetical protein